MPPKKNFRGKRYLTPIPKPAREGMAVLATQNIIDFLEGKTPAQASGIELNLKENKFMDLIRRGMKN